MFVISRMLIILIRVVESYALAISFMMNRCCSHLLNLGQFAQFFDQLGLKIMPLISQQFFRETIMNSSQKAATVALAD